MSSKCLGTLANQQQEPNGNTHHRRWGEAMAQPSTSHAPLFILHIRTLDAGK